MSDDPRKAKTLDQAALNSDGTYNCIKALSWLSEVLSPGHGIPESQVAKIAEQVKAKTVAKDISGHDIP